MEPVIPFDWQRIFLGEEPPLYLLEIVFRVVVIYIFAVLLLRLTGKRGKRQLSHFELVIVIALGSAVGDSMFYPEVPILYAWLIITLIVLLDLLLSELQMRSKAMNSFLEGDPRMLVENGRILDDSLDKERLRRDELMALLREQEVADTGEVKYAFLEETGHLGLIKYEPGEKVSGVNTFPDDLQN
jgi:uncharacterized membrane protein YcaP (DUF421 family)